MSASVTEGPPTYPMIRGCPFDPPAELTNIQTHEKVRRVKIWNGTEPLLVTGFDLARQVLSDPRLSSDTSTPGFPAANPGYVARRQVAKAFVNMDDPRHAEMRRSVTYDFTAKRSEAMRPRIQAMVDELIDQMLAGPKPADLVSDLSLPLPSMITCEMLGVPFEDRDQFYEQARIVNLQTTTAEEASAATATMADYLGDLLDEKRSHPADDLISKLASEQLATGQMTRDDVVGLSMMLFNGGFETTSNMIALGALTLLENPDALAELRETDDPKVIANAVEELLRFLTILHLGRRRVALEDMEIDGHRVKAGEGVIIAHDAANRDPEAFPDPDKLDLHRRARHHLAFGYGIHQCLGQSLARVELQVVHGTLYRRIPTLTLAGPIDELKFKYNSLIYGLYELPITW